MSRLFTTLGCVVLLSACSQVDASQYGAASLESEPIMSAGAALVSTEAPTVRVYKTPTCGCCSGWVTHLEEEGFDVEVQDLNDLTPVKDEMGVPTELRSCHTAEIDGLVIEGHVPAETIREVLADRGDLAGIAVPGMPVGSPGMEVPGRAADSYRVIGFTADGARRVVAQH